ncbi:PREDICTED: uncharacterized protein LOC109584317 [Amphimedon queenslandica]|uniref:Fibronectin type-III domain-containing protein n=1 Tax=Amphimedon queenslandica TaxID=400682 RepID=A0AAN0JF29_AMPQE|nr:PREDICTED: uncharacterized protein LOC109584317 [Amphimedon queenslandica]|eukprot:XP_019855569.1 PREDICTED: uncharacterized protein LOC109584317 [Amphimedon queenslandica]
MVSNNRVTDSKANEDYVPAFSDSRSLTIGVAEAPTGLAVMLTGSTTVQVSWSHAGTTSHRYEVFQVHNNRTQSVFNTSMDTVANIKGLTQGESYTFFVIAISLNTSSGILLPSEHSVPVSISIPSNKPSTTSTSSTLMRSSMTLTPSLVSTRLSSSSQVVSTMSPSISQFPSNSPQPSVVRPTPGNVDDPDISSVGLTAGALVISLLSLTLLVLIVVHISGIVAIRKTKPKEVRGTGI